MAQYLMARGHYLNQCSLITYKILNLNQPRQMQHGEYPNFKMDMKK